MRETVFTARLGVDTGGTFTDLVLVSNGEISSFKLPSTPDDPGRAILAGVSQLLGSKEEAVVFHGSTVATNALLEGKGADVALLVTSGFADLLEIGRQHRPDLYAIEPENPRPPLPEKRIYEIAERLGADGVVLQAPDPADLHTLCEQLTRDGVESVAVVLLHSYVNSAHEKQICSLLRSRGIRVSASHEILPEYREFERASTTVVNAMVSPVMESYLERLESGLQDNPLKVMQSNGGSIMARTAGREAVRTILSGPAGGMVGAFSLAQSAGHERILTFDMGGTSTDVGLCDGNIPSTSETEIGGWPVKVPMIDIHTVGAGGGSLARLDAGGALRVGPESAGADPGPACYGQGNAVTVTDANLYLGRLLPEQFLGGRMPLDSARCIAVVERLAAEAGLPPERLAEGVVEVAEATMIGALRVVSVSRGHDPRQFILVPFGGAGGLHACSLADALHIDTIMIPPLPGLLSAVGMVLSDAIRDYSHSVLLSGVQVQKELQARFAPLEKAARKDLAPEQIPEEQITFFYTLDMRYRGQSYEVEVPFGEGYVAAFHQLHDRRYGYQDEKRQVEIVNLRLRAVGDHRHQPIVLARPGRAAPGMEDSRKVWIDGVPKQCQVWLRHELGLDSEVIGPALVVEETATHLVRPGWTARLDVHGNLMMERNDDS